METRFTWDPAKALRNLQLHGVSFESATEVFSDPHQVIRENYFIDGEQRYDAIGVTLDVVLLLVVFVDSTEAGTETIHIVSARKAEKYETRIYTAQLQKS